MTASGPPRLVRHLATVDSTNHHALALAAAGAPGGSVVVADEQTAGRGRRGRDWVSPEGGLYLSYVVRPIDTIARPGLLTLAAGVAARRAIARTSGIELRLKWPNDVVTTDEPPRKIAGILAEASSIGSQLEYVVIGVGINVAPVSVPEGRLAAASLESELGRQVDRAALQDALIHELDLETARLRAGGDQALRAEWSAYAPGARGARVSWRAGERVLEGVTEGIDDEGALLVRTPAFIERLVSGDVTWA